MAPVRPLIIATALLAGLQASAGASQLTRAQGALRPGFLGAPAAAIAAAGLPPAPNAPIASEQYQTWERVIRSARTPLDVDFVPSTDTPPERIFQPDWAGPVLFAPGAQPMKIPDRRFSDIQGEWPVPAAKPTINCSNRFESTDGSSLWIALDGWMSTFYAHEKRDGKWHRYESTDILQAGSESDVPCFSGGPLTDYHTHSYFWIEWAGVRNIAVTRHRRNLIVKPGDTIYVRIAAQTTGRDAWQRATLWFVNETTGFYLPARTFHSGCVDCNTPFQRPATLFGSTAEWITEATFYSSYKRSLPNTLNDFGRVRMTSASVTDQDGTTYAPGMLGQATENVDWMTWNGVPLSLNGTLLACSSIEAPATVRFARAPYVIATPGQQGQLEPKPQSCR
jgi:Peptidase A4 family